MKEKTRQLFRKKEQKRERTEWLRGKGRKIFRNGNDERMRERDREAGQRKKRIVYSYLDMGLIRGERERDRQKE